VSEEVAPGESAAGYVRRAEPGWPSRLDVLRQASGRSSWLLCHAATLRGCGSITRNAFGLEFPDGGLNEAGLCEMTLLGTAYPPARRLNEAAKLGFRRCIVPATRRHAGDVPAGIEAILASSLSVALAVALGREGRRPRKAGSPVTQTPD